MGVGEGARDEQRGGPHRGWDFGGGWLASRCREALVGGGGWLVWFAGGLGIWLEWRGESGDI